MTAIKTGTTDRTKPNVTDGHLILVILDGNHLILFGFRYELLNPPAKGKMVFCGTRTRDKMWKNSSLPNLSDCILIALVY